ncbi:hypothetical protein F5Y14DRAFT_9430 [Nemania sp. NC0429]|nr:hypothetical protein F5Y14DRAFT_9430 [Nemania sp. NC0429]
MSWLNEQIKKDTVTQDESLLEGFVKLLHLRNYTEIDSFSLEQVDEVFNRWLDKEAIQNPTYRRRFLIAQQDVQRLFFEARQQTHNLGFASMPGPESGWGENHLLALLCEQIDDGVKTGEESTNLQRNASHEMSSSATQNSRSRGGDRLVNSSDQLNRCIDAGAAPSRHSSDVHSPATNMDDLDTKPEGTLKTSPPDRKMPQNCKGAGRRPRKDKARNDVTEFFPPPRNYICKRCHEPGHWIQHCPTNLDPRYDQAPPRDYQCYFCGLQGAHFATLCEKNPNLGSLAKQRENIMFESREPRTPSRGKRHHYQDQVSPMIRFRDRYRSRSPEQQYARTQYRSRSREYPQCRPIGPSSYSPGARDDDDGFLLRRNDEPDVSPYTTRARLTRERHTSPETYEERESPSQTWVYSLRFESQPSTPPTSRRYSSRYGRKLRGQHIDLDKVPSTRTDEGRLAYDDEIDAPAVPRSSPCSPIARSSQHVGTNSIGGENVAESAVSPVTATPEGAINIEDRTDNFLHELAAELMSGGEFLSRPMMENDHETERGVGRDPAPAIRIENNQPSTAVSPGGPALHTAPIPIDGLVRCPPFSPRIASLFNARENPIINTRANRQTASQMMERSERFLEKCVMTT